MKIFTGHRVGHGLFLVGCFWWFVLGGLFLVGCFWWIVFGGLFLVGCWLVDIKPPLRTPLGDIDMTSESFDPSHSCVCGIIMGFHR